MADNVTLPATGEIVSTDDVGGVQYQRIKVDLGGDGVSVPLVGATSPQFEGGLGLPVRVAGQDMFTCSFASVLAASISPDFTERRVGTGIGRSQAGGNLLITTGTTTNAEYLVRTNRTFSGSWIKRWKFTASQRIANQNLVVMLADSIGEGLSYLINSATSISVTKTAHGFTAENVGQFMMVGAINGAAGVPGRWAIASIPNADTINFTVAAWPASGSGTLDLFGWNYVRTLYNGTSATTQSFDTQRKGWADTAVSAAFTSSAAPGHIGQVLNDGRNLYLGDTVPNSATTPNISTRASRIENIPDESVSLNLFIWSYNGTTAPASTTTWTIGFISLEKFANIPVFLAGQRMMGTQAPQPVQVTNSYAVTLTSGTVTTVSNVTAGNITPVPNAAQGASTFLRRLLTADTNVASIKASNAVVNTLSVFNDSATKFYLKLYNLAVAPTLASSVPVMTIPVPPGTHVPINCGPHGIRFATGLAIAVVRGIADTDTTAVVANDGVLSIVYT